MKQKGNQPPLPLHGMMGVNQRILKHIDEHLRWTFLDNLTKISVRLQYTYVSGYMGWVNVACLIPVASGQVSPVRHLIILETIIIR